MKNIRSLACFITILLTAAFAVQAFVRERRAKTEEAFVAEKMQAVTLSVGGIQRHALLHLPAGYDAKKPHPVVIVLHGMGGTPEALALETGMVPKSDAEGFIAVFPAATRPDMSKPPKFGSNNPAWNDGSGRFHAGEQKVDDVAFIAALLDHLESGHAVDTRRVYVTGFSNGASMTFRVGLELSERLAAIAPVSGALWITEPKVEQPVSLLYLTGTSDPINPMDGGAPKMASGSGFKEAPDKAKPPVRDSVTAWARMLGCQMEPQTSSAPGVTTERYVGGRGGSEVLFMMIADQGHVWPGAKSPLPEFIVGKATQNLNATDAVWDFFKGHPK